MIQPSFASDSPRTSWLMAMLLLEAAICDGVVDCNQVRDVVELALSSAYTLQQEYNETTLYTETYLTALPKQFQPAVRASVIANSRHSRGTSSITHFVSQTEMSWQYQSSFFSECIQKEKTYENRRRLLSPPNQSVN